LSRARFRKKQSFAEHNDRMITNGRIRPSKWASCTLQWLSVLELARGASNIWAKTCALSGCAGVWPSCPSPRRLVTRSCRFVPCVPASTVGRCVGPDQTKRHVQARRLSPGNRMLLRDGATSRKGDKVGPQQSAKYRIPHAAIYCDELTRRRGVRAERRIEADWK
jgi:hypothetical protein